MLIAALTVPALQFLSQFAGVTATRCDAYRHKVATSGLCGKKLTVSERPRSLVESFVAVLGASQLGYLQAVESQQSLSAGAPWSISGGAGGAGLLKSAVTRDLNRAYAASTATT